MPDPSFALESPCLKVEFNRTTTALVLLHNKLTDETYRIDGDVFAIAANSDRYEFCNFTVKDSSTARDSIVARYSCEAFDVEVVYRLGTSGHFIEKQLTLLSRRDCALCEVVVSRPRFASPDLDLVCYRHPSYERIEAQHNGHCKREPNTEPVKTYFGRTKSGGLFTGLEMPFDRSIASGNQIELAFSPSLKFRAGEKLTCEPMYLGVYARDERDAHAADWRPADSRPDATLPLPSESAAMVAMTSALIPPHRHGLVAMANGWHSQLEQAAYTEQSLAHDMHALEVMRDCGIDWVGDSHPWGGEIEKMNALTEGQRYEIGEMPRRWLEHARKVGVKVVQWPTMNNTNPWLEKGKRPFRADKPEWRRLPTTSHQPGGEPASGIDELDQIYAGNCIANRPFREWIKNIFWNAMDSGYYDSWAMDGDFWGSGAYFHTTVPVRCASEQHDHLPVDSNYACQRALDEMIAEVRQRYPNVLIVVARPMMDLGVWSNLNVHACFTLIETGSAESNLVGGDEIRTASRIRVQHHFFPHYIDWPVLFPSYYLPEKIPPWPSAHLDYILLSGLSSAPNLLMYLPTRTGFPNADKAEIRRWMEWGRANIDFLMVRHDLPAWPAPGKVDGSAHLVGDRGLIFLFNSSEHESHGEFELTTAGIGLRADGEFIIRQEHPSASSTETRRGPRRGDKVQWPIPARTAVVLRLEPSA